MKMLAMTMVVSATAGGAAMAGPTGDIDTDRFGYTGSIVRFDSLADAQNQSNSVDTIGVGDRDASMTFSSGGSFAEENIFLGSWWYTTDEGFGPGQGRAGWGNTTGNTGVGYAQLFDSDGSTDTNVDMTFSDFDGTHWTQFNLSVTGENADGDDFSRLSAIDNVSDGGIWHNYSMDLQATGLEGALNTSSGLIEATNHATGVSGTFSGIFEITEPDNAGFYRFSFDLSMTNWAWANRDDLTPQVSADGGATFFNGEFRDSFFAAQAIPLPHPAAMAAAGLAGIAVVRRRR